MSFKGEGVKINMLKEIKDAWDKMDKAMTEYKMLRDSCKHTGIKTWKPKYGGYFCEDCETFLPRESRNASSPI